MFQPADTNHFHVHISNQIGMISILLSHPTIEQCNVTAYVGCQSSDLLLVALDGTKTNGILITMDTPLRVTFPDFLCRVDTDKLVSQL
jgi:hypothetical protein